MSSQEKEISNSTEPSNKHSALQAPSPNEAPAHESRWFIFQMQTFIVAIFLGAAIGIYIGFQHGGIGGALLGIVAGGVCGGFVVRFIFEALVPILLLVLFGIVVAWLWGVGNP